MFVLMVRADTACMKLRARHSQITRVFFALSGDGTGERVDMQHDQPGISKNNEQEVVEGSGKAVYMDTVDFRLLDIIEKPQKSLADYRERGVLSGASK